MSLNLPKDLYGITALTCLSSFPSSRALLEGKSIKNPIRGTWASIHEVYIVVVTAATLLLKLDAQVHDWAFKGTSLGDQTHLSSWLFLLLRCKMSLILPKHLYGITPSSIAVMMWGDPELETCSIWDQEPDTGGVIVSSQPIRRQMKTLSRVSRQLEEMSQLKKKIGGHIVEDESRKKTDSRTRRRRYGVLFEKDGRRVCLDKTGFGF